MPNQNKTQSYTQQNKTIPNLSLLYKALNCRSEDRFEDPLFGGREC